MKRHVLIRGFFLCLGILLIAVPIAFAAEWAGDDTIVIEANEVISDDFYVGAESLTVDGTIEGDLFFGGTTLIINGTVEGDVFAGGQSIIINGSVEDDVRAAGTVIELNSGASVGGDLMFAGYSATVEQGSTIGQDMLFAGLQTSIEGAVGRNLLFAGNNLEINGRVGGYVRAEVGSDDGAPPFDPTQFTPDAPSIPVIPAGLTIGDGAEIGGDLTYSSPDEATIPATAVQGDTDFDLQLSDDSESNNEPNPIWRPIRRLIGLLLVGLLMVWRAPALFERLSNLLQERPLPSLGVGAAAYFGTPIVLLILLGISIAIAALLGLIGLGNIGASLVWIVVALSIVAMVVLVMLLIYITKLIVGYLVGKMVLDRLSPSLAENPMWVLVVGIIIVVILISIPFLGALVNFVIAIVGLGVFFLMWQSSDTLTEKAPEDSQIAV